MKSRASNLWQQVRSSLWFVPGAMALLSVGLVWLTLTLDHRSGLLPKDNGWFWSGEPQGARDMLITIAGSMITVAGVAFSITIVALTLAANQFGPRLLRNFMRDTGNQVVLGTFVATFLYCLLTLRMVRAVGETVFVPHVSVTVAVALAVASIGVLIYFIHHVAMSLQAENLARSIAHELGEVIDALFPEKLGQPPAEEEAPAMRVPQDDGGGLRPVLARRSGYLQAIENDGLMATAEKRELVLCLRCTPGEFVVEGDPLVDVWPAHACDDELEGEIAGLFFLGRHRTPTQDVNYAMQQLVTVAVRALSPGINDPFTTVTCVDWIGDALRKMAERRTPRRFRLDRNGWLRVIAPPPSFPALADVALNPIRQYGAEHVSVVLRLLAAVAVVAGRAERPEDRAALERHADLVLEAASRVGHQQRDLATIQRAHRQVRLVLSGRPADGDATGTRASERA